MKRARAHRAPVRARAPGAASAPAPRRARRHPSNLKGGQHVDHHQHLQALRREFPGAARLGGPLPAVPQVPGAAHQPTQRLSPPYACAAPSCPAQAGGPLREHVREQACHHTSCPAQAGGPPREHVRERACHHTPGFVTVRRNPEVAVCSAFPFAAVSFSSSARTLNPKVGGSSPPRPIGKRRRLRRCAQVGCGWSRGVAWGGCVGRLTGAAGSGWGVGLEWRVGRLMGAVGSGRRRRTLQNLLSFPNRIAWRAFGKLSTIFMVDFPNCRRGVGFGNLSMTLGFSGPAAALPHHSDPPATIILPRECSTAERISRGGVRDVEN